ncbi:MAG: hypothetical protein ACRC4N_16005 [Gammaproteobacteria bacterium]
MIRGPAMVTWWCWESNPNIQYQQSNTLITVLPVYNKYLVLQHVLDINMDRG